MLVFPIFPYIAPAGGGDVPNRSLDLVAASSQSLELSDAFWGSYNRNKWAFSCYARRKDDSGTHTIFSKYGASSGVQEILIAFDFNRSMTIITRNAATDGILLTTQYGAAGNGFEAGIWYHIYVTFDASAAAADRLQLVINRVRFADISTETQPVGSIITTTTPVRIGHTASGSWPANAYIYQPTFFNGVIPNVNDIVNLDNSPKDLRGMTGVYSLLHTTDSSVITQDEVKANNWTNNNTVTKSILVP